MTLPDERANALRNVRAFLSSLMVPGEIKTISEARRHARALLKHFPEPHLIDELEAGGHLGEKLSFLPGRPRAPDCPKCGHITLRLAELFHYRCSCCGTVWHSQMGRLVAQKGS